MKYIVTGAEGFVGKAIIKYLKSKKIDVVGISKKNNKKNTFKHNLEKPLSFRKIPTSQPTKNKME